MYKTILRYLSVFFVKYFKYVFLKNLKDILMLFCTSILDSISGVDFIHWMIKKNIAKIAKW